MVISHMVVAYAGLAFVIDRHSDIRAALISAFWVSSTAAAVSNVGGSAWSPAGRTEARRSRASASQMVTAEANGSTLSPQGRAGRFID